MKRLLFSERANQPKPRVSETLPSSVRIALFQLIQSKIENNSFGLAFPEQCSDGRGIAGTDERALKINMDAFHVIWPSEYISRDDDEVSDSQIFDLLEYSWEHVATPVAGDYHSWFSHYHYSYDQTSGRHLFATEVNRILEHNGIAFDLREGQVERLVPTVLQDVLVTPIFLTGDDILDSLLTTAREKFLNRDLITRREALEKLWDAWERMKSLSHANKAQSVKMLLDNAVTEPKLREKVELEARQLTDIGNEFLIRHAEVGKPAVVESRHVDYLFHRLFAMIRMVLVARGIQI